MGVLVHMCVPLQMESIWRLPDMSPLEFVDKLSLWVQPFLSDMNNEYRHESVNKKTDKSKLAEFKRDICLFIELHSENFQ